MPRLLFVAMPESIHTARWIAQIAEQGWDIYLFPCYAAPMHPELRHLTAFASAPPRRTDPKHHVRRLWWTLPFFLVDWVRSKLRRAPVSSMTSRALALAIRGLQPDIVHSLEIQHAGYLALDARQRLRGRFPKWIVTNWGSDIYLFGRLPEHKARIRAVLAACDYYSCECERDVRLARESGFEGTVLPVLPNTGGFDLAWAAALQEPGPVSSRRTILLKGYQHWAGRALVGLEALRRCADLLQGYSLAISVASPEVRIAAELFRQDTGIPVQILEAVSHEEMLRTYGRSRLYLGLSISDAISTSLLEAMVMGAFPIQSCTACADEWIEDGRSGLVVPPEDPAAVAEAVRRGLADDDLVDRAAQINASVARARLDRSILGPRVIQMYADILGTGRTS